MIQQRNKRNNIKLTFQEETKTIMEWAKELGVSHSTLYLRYHVGWPTEKILTTPIR